MKLQRWAEMTYPFLFREVTNRTYKSTYQVLKEISDVWDDLSDKNQAQLLEKLFGKTRADMDSSAQKCA